MKRIVFVINNMHMGGTRKSLLSLLSELTNRDDVSVDLLIMSHEGPLLYEVPNKVNVIDKDIVVNALLSRKNELKDIRSKLIRIVCSFGQRVFGYEKLYPIIYKNRIKAMNLSYYDAAIGFQEGPSNDFAFYINAKKHFAWIHNDYDNFKQSKSNRGISVIYKQFDRIIFVADASKDNFLKSFPDLIEKTILIKNTINKKDILKRGAEPTSYPFTNSGVKFVTVGRAGGSNQKGFDRLIKVASMLKNKGYVFEWKVIGGGEKLEVFRRDVLENGLVGYVEFVGQTNNPYATVSKADLYVMTSRYESQPLVLLEALLLGVPVLTTRFNSAEELCGGKMFARIVDNSTEGLFEGLEKLIRSYTDIDVLRNNTNVFEYDNDRYINELLELCE